MGEVYRARDPRLGSDVAIKSGHRPPWGTRLSISSELSGMLTGPHRKVLRDTLV